MTRRILEGQANLTKMAGCWIPGDSMLLLPWFVDTEIPRRVM